MSEEIINQQEQKEQEEQNNIQLSSVSLTSWEWHCVLSDLKFRLKFIGYDHEMTCRAIEQIASQLAGYTITMERPKKEPELEKKPEPEPQKPLTFWKKLRLFNRSLID